VEDAGKTCVISTCSNSESDFGVDTLALVATADIEAATIAAGVNECESMTAVCMEDTDAGDVDDFDDTNVVEGCALTGRRMVMIELRLFRPDSKVNVVAVEGVVELVLTVVVIVVVIVVDVVEVDAPILGTIVC
jgi:hypothetical protein